jgi:succinate dehydrogenase/fumarate reductase flavoprotein subunit
VFYEDWTGDEIVHVLMEQVRKRKIDFEDDIFITSLITSRGLDAKGSDENA